ncbi:hypothetical protein PAXRUDRAFT_690017 [Paxillus rubicundulus Ve08.2h10]|uniref:Uncharacterized protein n=1 Tax=Paxillus rubicundulus Ve08.2h10 TaxID=930991 RepID=A0A0D0E2X9_9AGAM|nr:hypothetical protein PAXRUDRAFT_690017 [Paxillus rubicundulus Ve08.2h10]
MKGVDWRWRAANFGHQRLTTGVVVMLATVMFHLFVENDTPTTPIWTNTRSRCVALAIPRLVSARLPVKTSCHRNSPCVASTCIRRASLPPNREGIVFVQDILCSACL